MIRFYNSAQDFIDDVEVRPFSMSQHTWDALKGSQMLRISSASNCTLSGDVDTLSITLTAAFPTTAESRYETYMALKQIAMMLGNVAAGVSNVSYAFTGYDKLIYRGGGTQPYIQSIQHTYPTASGAIHVLSSPCVGVTVDTEGAVVATVDGVLCDACAKYLELTAFCWRLYHAANELAHRIYDFDPTHKYWGAWPSYQALVAVWNNSVWKKNYRMKMSTIREALTLEVGFNCTACTLDGLTLKVRIDILSAFTPAGYSYPSTNELLLYQMGLSQVATDAVKSATTVTITKYVTNVITGAVTGIVESGVGNEPVDALAPSWTYYEADVAVPSMNQQDSIVVQFALARAMYSASGRNIPRADQYTGSTLPAHNFRVTLTWSPIGGEDVSRVQDITVLALDNTPETV